MKSSLSRGEYFWWGITILLAVTLLCLAFGTVVLSGTAAQIAAAGGVIAAIYATRARDLDIARRIGWRTIYMVVFGVIALVFIGRLDVSVGVSYSGAEYHRVASQTAVAFYWMYFLLTLPPYISGSLKRGAIGDLPPAQTV